MSAECIFCKIATDAVPAKKFYEDDEVMAFHDIRPLARVHFLIVPKQHIETLKDCQTEHQALLGKMLLLAAQLASEQGLVGYKTQINVGREGGQEVFHLHLHVFGGGPVV
ncbi:histidine triad nucleotide-binding protein [Methylophilus aquaticus]|uniref:Histidine triad nucleotide-binding protein n=1 Tax=Methylophilus aquaticus TaxID=1971610 RepID=A0ABT9JWA0_9PROT|nr:histidine triad nucleotide-binding protein [Methylophilus aquaticus]MDP8568837.1 histidine triad nucleotide-binding protein [Methylophilus aquaticus]